MSLSTPRNTGNTSKYGHGNMKTYNDHQTFHKIKTIIRIYAESFLHLDDKML
jgi:hypothetical protein